MAVNERDISREDGHKRAIEDYSQFSQYARSAAQFAFAANGGAAGAVLSFMTALVNSPIPKSSFDKPVIIHTFAVACSCYLAGVLTSIASMWFFAVSKKRWGDAWKDTALTGQIDFKSYFSRAAQHLEQCANVTLVVSALIFGIGSAFAVLGFFRQ
jgi:multidrug efflux pump subunit AcrB